VTNYYRLLLKITLAPMLLTAVELPAACQTWIIPSTSLQCSEEMGSNGFQQVDVVCTGWTRTTFQDSFKFFAVAQCYNCSTAGQSYISASVEVIVGLTQACQQPVTTVFYGSIDDNGVNGVPSVAAQSQSKVGTGSFAYPQTYEINCDLQTSYSGPPPGYTNPC
jgi:hypothetical protein